MYRLDSDKILRVPGLEAFSWLEHGFGTKKSEGWPAEEYRATLKQIHSTQVAVADGPGVWGEGDALVTNMPGLFVAVKTADCIPILLVDPERRVVAAIHAGWRGTAGNIVRSTISTMVSEFHTDVSGVWAAIGPGIGKCCYEVSGDVAVQFVPWLPEYAGAPERTMLDLTEVNRRQMIHAGVASTRIVTSEGGCTCCRDELHSFRRDRERSGRMLSAIRVRPA